MSDARKDPRLGVPSSVTRARVERMVLEIARLMTAGQWDAEKFAAREGVSIDATQQYSARASRWLKAIPQEELAALRARNLERLDAAHDMALEKQAATLSGDLYDAPDIRSAVGAIAEQNKLLGLIVERHEVSGSALSRAEWESFRADLLEVCCEDCRTKLLARRKET